MSFFDYLENKVLDHVVGKTAYTSPTVYIGLSSTTPAEDGTSVTEPSAGAYARVSTAAGDCAAAAAGANSNANAENFRLNVGIMIMNREHQVLAGEAFHYQGEWMMPQGGIDPDESAFAAMQRELMEETGLGFDQVRLLYQLTRIQNKALTPTAY